MLPTIVTGRLTPLALALALAGAFSLSMAPAQAAPVAKANNFMRTSGTPMAIAATSSSRIAVQARPIAELSSRCAKMMMTPKMAIPKK